MVGAAVYVLGLRVVKSAEFHEYVEEGGGKSFWSWVTADEKDLDDELGSVASERAAKRGKARTRREHAAGKAAEARIAMPER